MANIYDFMSGFMALWNLVEDETIEDSVIEECFENMTDDFKVKMENCCKYIKCLDSDIEGLKAEEKRIKEMRQAMENSKERLKNLMYKAQVASGEKKLVCGSFTTSIQANPPKVVLDVTDVNGIPEYYLTFPDPEPNKKKISEALKNGFECEFAHLETSESLRIR